MSSFEMNYRKLEKAPSVAIIGVSGFAAIHYEILIKLHTAGELKLLAATVINPGEEPNKCRILQGIDCQIFDSYAEMLAKLQGKIDLCFIPTGIQHHCPMSLAAMEAGANVYVEKPVAATIQEVRSMQESELRTKRFCAVGYQGMFQDETLWMKAAILNGEIGEIRALKALALLPRPSSYYARNQWAGNLRCRGDWVLDSPFNNAAAHQINLMGFLAGPSLGKSATMKSIFAELARAYPITSPDTVHLSIQTTTGVPLDFYASHCGQNVRGPEVVVRGSRGEIICTDDEISIIRDDGSTERRTPSERMVIQEHAIRAVLRRLSDPEEFICSLTIAEVQTICANGAHESARICDVPPDLLTWEGTGDFRRVLIEDLDRIMIGAFEKEERLVDHGFDWLEPGQVVSLVGYDSFKGPHDQ